MYLKSHMVKGDMYVLHKRVIHLNYISKEYSSIQGPLCQQPTISEPTKTLFVNTLGHALLLITEYNFFEKYNKNEQIML